MSIYNPRMNIYQMRKAIRVRRANSHVNTTPNEESLASPPVEEEETVETPAAEEEETVETPPVEEEETVETQPDEEEEINE